MTAWQDPSFPDAGPYDWNQTKISWSSESLVFSQFLEPETGTEDTESEVAESEDHDIDELKIFQCISRERALNELERLVIEAVCPPKSLRALRLQETSGNVLNQVTTSWIDERSMAGVPRTTNGIKTTQGLYDGLLAKRFATASASDSREGPAPNADRRLIYIPNPNEWSIAALILGASVSQGQFLSDFLFKHLSAERAISARITKDGRLFCLEFHFNFFVLDTTQQEKRHDTRKGSMKSSLRDSLDLSFLRKPQSHCSTDNPRDYLYEAQVSTMVTGHHKSIYVAYCLIDTFFHEGCSDNDRDKDSIRYYSDALADGMNWDPIAGTLDADIPIMDARVYFFSIMDRRAERLKDEWSSLIAFLQLRIENYIKSPDVYQSHSKFTIGAAKEHSNSIQKTYIWLASSSKLLQRLIKTLSDNINEWQRFKQSDLEFFYSGKPVEDAEQPITNDYSSDRCRKSFLGTDRSFAELQKNLSDLIYLEKQQNNFRDKLNLYLEVENNRALVLQYWNFTFMHVASPPALAASVLQSCAPFESSWASFFFWLLIFGGLTWGIRPVLTWFYSRRRLTSSDQSNGSRGKDSPTSSQGFQETLPASFLLFPQPTFANKRHLLFRRRKSGLAVNSS